MNKRKLLGKRKEFGYTQQEVAKVLGISEVAYRQKEKGQREFTESEIRKLCDLFNVDANYFFN